MKTSLCITWSFFTDWMCFCLIFDGLYHDDPWCTMEIITIKAPPFWRICSRNFFQASNKQMKGICENNRPLDRTKNYAHPCKLTQYCSDDHFPSGRQKSPKAPWSSLKAILLRCGVSLCDGHWFGWVSESPWPFTKKDMIWGAFKHLILGNL